MRKLFNNQWFIVGLAVFAFGYLAIRVALPMFDDAPVADADNSLVPPFGDDSQDPSPLPGSAAVATTDAPQKQSASKGATSYRDVGWNTNIDRDPFAVAESQAAAAPRARQPVARPAPPTVSALFRGNGVPKAVVDGRLVSEGQRVGAFEVEAIDDDRVLLNDGFESFHVYVGEQ